MRSMKLLSIIFATALAVESKRIPHQKRETQQSICDPVYSNTNKVQCFCIRDHNADDSVRSAECYLTKSNPSVNDSEWESFQEIQSVEKLILTNTRGVPFKYVPTHALNYLPDLVNINIKYGEVKEIVPNAFRNLSRIQEIILSDDQIEVLHHHAFYNHKKLITITLDTNKITEINRDVFVELPLLEQLFLTNNKITTLHDRAFIHLVNLKQLELDKNRIFSLNSETFSGLKNLQRLELGGNSLEVIGDNTFSPLINLQSLHLDENKIEVLDEKAFKGLSNLRLLSLAGNRLTVLDNVKIFEGLKSLVSLNIKGNKMQSLKEEVLRPILEHFYSEVNSLLDFDDNEFPCECKLDWLLILGNKTQNKRLKLSIENLKCNPDAQLTEQWKKQQEVDKNNDANKEEAAPSADYEYYDETQLDGKLFYIDIRDLLNCPSKLYFPPPSDISSNISPENSLPKIDIISTTIKPSTIKNIATPKKFTETNIKKDLLVKQNSSTSEIKTKRNDIDKKNKVINHGSLDLSVGETDTGIPTTQSITKIEPYNKFEKQQSQAFSEIKSDERQKTFTTSRLATVSAKPTQNLHPTEDDKDMASDEAIPPDVSRHAQRYSETEDIQISKGNINFSSVALTISILTFCFRLV